MRRGRKEERGGGSSSRTGAESRAAGLQGSESLIEKQQGLDGHLRDMTRASAAATAAAQLAAAPDGRPNVSCLPFWNDGAILIFPLHQTSEDCVCMVQGEFKTCTSKAFLTPGEPLGVRSPLGTARVAPAAWPSVAPIYNPNSKSKCGPIMNLGINLCRP